MRHLFVLLGIYAVGLCLTLFGAYIDSDPPSSNPLQLGMEILLMSTIVFGLLSGIFYSLYFSFRFLKQWVEQRFA